MPETFSNELPIVASYSRTGETELRGSSLGLLSLARLLTSDEPSSAKFRVPDKSSVYPYDAFLHSVSVTRNEQPVTITRENNTLVISGSLDHLSLLADNIIGLATQASDHTGHLHIDYYPDHFFLSPLSDSLVVERDDSLTH